MIVLWGKDGCICMVGNVAKISSSCCILEFGG